MASDRVKLRRGVAWFVVVGFSFLLGVVMTLTVQQAFAAANARPPLEPALQASGLSTRAVAPPVVQPAPRPQGVLHGAPQVEPHAQPAGALEPRVVRRRSADFGPLLDLGPAPAGCAELVYLCASLRSGSVLVRHLLGVLAPQVESVN